MLKKIISLTLALVIITSIFATVFASQRQDNEKIQELTLEEKAAIDAEITIAVLAKMGHTLEELLVIDAEKDTIAGEIFSENQRKAMRQHRLLYEEFMRTNDGTIIFPDFYGGSYIDYNGHLVLLIVESYHEAQTQESVRILIDAGVSYRFVEFSYAELIAAHATIASITSARSQDGCRYSNNIGHGGNDARINRAVIGLIVYNEEMIAGFRRYVYDSPMITFEPSSWGQTDGHINAPFAIAIAMGIFTIVCGIMFIPRIRRP